MITQSGIHIQKIGGAAGTPSVEDIAVHSARICRFGGAVWYSLLQHLVFVGLLANRRGASCDTLAWAFLHDAHEIATSDVPRPFKCDCMRTEQDAIDARLMAAFRIDHSLVDHNLIKQCDDDACDIEAVVLGVPGFSEIEMAHTKAYRNRTAIYSDLSDTKLFNAVLRVFGDIRNVYGMDGPGVARFAWLLYAIEDRGDTTILQDFCFTWEREAEILNG